MDNATWRTHRKRSIVLAIVALFVWALFSVLLPLAGGGSEATLLGMPLGTALALPIALPVIVLTAFWHAARQNAEDDRFSGDE
jgi:drug/metabolite transporter (DMT)-like permease